MAKDLFAITNAQSVNVVTLSLPENIDAVDFDRLNETLLRALENTGGTSWVLDMSEVTYMGSAVLGLMVNIRQLIKQRGGKLALCGMSDRLIQIFRTCSLERLFTITKTQPEALAAVKK